MSHPHPSWPDGLITYKRTPEFSEDTVPAGLRRAHSTKAGVWARLHVIDGELWFRDLARGTEQLLGRGEHSLIFPQCEHEVAPVGKTRFFVEFHRLP